MMQESQKERSQSTTILTAPEWATAGIFLLAKSTKLTDPADFRPIALTNTVSKIFFGVLSK
jgi:hypothetical protein